MERFSLGLLSVHCSLHLKHRKTPAEATEIHVTHDYKDGDY